jgi:hypothetical protein
VSDRQNAIRLLAADAQARGLSCFSNSLKIIADGYGDLEAENAALKEENERLKAALKAISANPYWDDCHKFVQGYWQRYNNIVLIADESIKEK